MSPLEVSNREARVWATRATPCGPIEVFTFFR